MRHSGRYYVKAEYRTADNNKVWNDITAYISYNKCFMSVTGVKYAAEIENNMLSFIGGRTGSRRAINGDQFTKFELLDVFSKIRKLDYVNTNVINDRLFMTVTFSYKRAPFIGLLYSVGIITDADTKM